MPDYPPAVRSASTRRSFLKRTTLAGLAASLMPGASRAANAPLRPSQERLTPPIAISSGNGDPAVARAVELMKAGTDALTAVIAGVNLVEADPDDITVGYGGVPNAEGVVELDAAVMHGPTGRSGAVASLQGYMYPSRVARRVLDRTDHSLLVGEGAAAFARMHGFEERELLTERARQIWLEWRENLSNEDDYLPPHGPDDTDIGRLYQAFKREYGTIHCSGLDLQGDLSCVTTTSGLFFKIPGRVGDSPIVGAGLYCDNDVGSAGSTGRGEANIENLSSFLIVERMRAGDHPEEACLAACRRIVEHTRLARLRDAEGRPNFNVRFFAMNREGVVGSAELWGESGTFAVADADGQYRMPIAYLYEAQR